MFALGGVAEAWGFVEDGQRTDLGDLLVVLAAATAEEVDGGVAGGGEKKGPGVGDAPAGVGAEGANEVSCTRSSWSGKAGKRLER